MFYCEMYTGHFFLQISYVFLIIKVSITRLMKTNKMDTVSEVKENHHLNPDGQSKGQQSSGNHASCILAPCYRTSIRVD